MREVCKGVSGFSKNDATDVFATSCLQLRCVLVWSIALLLHLQWLLDSSHFELVRVDPI